MLRVSATLLRSGMERTIAHPLAPLVAAPSTTGLTRKQSCGRDASAVDVCKAERSGHFEAARLVRRAGSDGRSRRGSSSDRAELPVRQWQTQ